MAICCVLVSLLAICCVLVYIGGTEIGKQCWEQRGTEHIQQDGVVQRWIRTIFVSNGYVTDDCDEFGLEDDSMARMFGGWRSLFGGLSNKANNQTNH